MRYFSYEEYASMEKSLSMEEMQRVHQQMLDEIGDDEDALELYEELVIAANKYSVFRSNWYVWDREVRMEQDESRTACHDALIVKFNKLARYLTMQGKDAQWRKILGDEKEHPYNRKRVGDFANYIVFVNSICAR